jgi:DNA-binding transcriptional ArsR family regulator
MAVAATVAAALAGCSVVYFRAKEYSRLKDKDEVVAKGVKADPSPIEIPIFHLLRPATQMREERLEVLTELVRVGKISNVKDLTLNRKRNLRGASLDAEHARLLYHLHELEKDALVKVERQIESKSNGKPTKLKEETKPTDLGKFIVELKRIENEVNREPVPNPD